MEKENGVIRHKSYDIHYNRVRDEDTYFKYSFEVKCLDEVIIEGVVEDFIEIFEKIDQYTHMKDMGELGRAHIIIAWMKNLVDDYRDRGEELGASEDRLVTEMETWLQFYFQYGKHHISYPSLTKQS